MTTFSKTLGLFTSVAMLALASTAHAEMTEKQVEAIVKRVIQEQPDLIVKSLQAMQAKAAAEQEANAAKAIKDNHKSLTQNKLAPTAGNPKGDVTIVEFFDYHCGYCKRMLPVVQEIIKADKNVKVVFQEYPILSPDSVTAAKAALAVNKINPKKYMDYHAKLMSNQGRFSEATLIKFAEDVGVDGAKVKEVMNSKEIAKYLDEVKALGEKVGVRGTPAMVIGEEFYPGALGADEVKAAIAKARKK